MRKTWMGRLQAAFIGGGLGLMAVYPHAAMEASREACRAWAFSVMPALFPYMVLSQWLRASLAAPFLTPPLAMLGGSPAGARLISLGGYTPKKAQAMAALCATASPLFILGTLSGGLPMLAAHLLGAILSYGLIRFWLGKQADTPAPAAESPPFALTDAIRDAALAMITVCGCMVLFAVITALLTRFLSLPAGPTALLSALLEMATGCMAIAALPLEGAWRDPLLCAAASFGGLSIFLQNALFLRPAGVDLRLQFAMKIAHAAIAFGLLFGYYRL